MVSNDGNNHDCCTSWHDTITKFDTALLSCAHAPQHAKCITRLFQHVSFHLVPVQLKQDSEGGKRIKQNILLRSNKVYSPGIKKIVLGSNKIYSWPASAPNQPFRPKLNVPALFVYVFFIVFPNVAGFSSFFQWCKTTNQP